jgi:hypothetical protein
MACIIKEKHYYRSINFSKHAMKKHSIIAITAGLLLGSLL